MESGSEDDVHGDESVENGFERDRDAFKNHTDASRLSSHTEDQDETDDQGMLREIYRYHSHVLRCASFFFNGAYKLLQCAIVAHTFA